MKKVLILNPYLPTLGGGEKDMGYLCKFIEKYYDENVVIDILVHNYNEIDVWDDNYVTIEDLNRQYGLNLKRTSLRKYDFIIQHNFIDSIRNRLNLESISKEYDIFINYMFNSKHIGKAKINIYRCMFPPRTFLEERGQGVLRKILARGLDYRFWKSYDAIVNISEFTSEWLDIIWGKKQNISMIYPPVFHLTNMRNRYDESQKRNIILSCGRFFVSAHSKKQKEMIQFFINHKDLFENYEYHLVGALADHEEDIEYFNTLQSLASMVDNIFLHPNCNYEELTDLYKKAKIFWHATGYGVDQNSEPEKMEHFGITTVEAMSYGAVPVVIDRGGQPEIVKDGINGFLWNTEEECINKTLRLINNDDLRKSMIEKSIQYSEKYSIETFYKGFEKIFTNLHI